MVSFSEIYNQVAHNGEQVREAMLRAGLGDHYAQVQQQMKQGHREFSLPVSYQVSEHEKMKLELNFKMDDSNNYTFHSYNAALHSGPKNTSIKMQTFEMDQTMNVDVSKAYHLLDGRAIQLVDGKSWKQLDFNDRDADGNYRYKNFSENYGFDLAKSISELPLKSKLDDAQIDRLKNGEKVEVVMLVGNKELAVSIAANPQNKDFSIYSADGQSIDKEALKPGGAKKRATVKQLVPKQASEDSEPKRTAVKIR